MSLSMTPASKNPIHPDSLEVGNLEIGREIIYFNLEQGIVGEYTVTSPPFVEALKSTSRAIPKQGSRQLNLITLQDDKGTNHTFSLADLGAAPYKPGCWNQGNFVIDADSREELPEPNPWPVFSVPGNEIRIGTLRGLGGHQSDIQYDEE